MHIKQLIHNEKEYWDLVWPFLDWSIHSNRSLWREEDYPKLKPFFDQQEQWRKTIAALTAHQPGETVLWSDEVKESFDFYQKCLEEYGNKNRELRDSVNKFSADDILKAFGYEVPAYEDDDDEDMYSKDKSMPLDKEFDVKFPFVVVGDIYSSWDRSGDMKVLSIYHVSLTAFK